jgi:hypothetical protein
MASRMASGAALLLLFASVAHADDKLVFDDELDPVPDNMQIGRRHNTLADEPAPRVHLRDDRDDRDNAWKVEGALGVGWGTFLVNNVDVGTVTQGHLDGGLRSGRLLLFAGYDLMSLTLPAQMSQVRGELDPGNGRGLMHRFGGNARYSYGRAGCRDVGVDLWAEAGVGVEHFRWDAGGVWTRPDLSLGLGGSWWLLGDKQHGALSAGIRITIAPRGDVAGAPIACAGPCDQATSPTGWDRSFLFDLKLSFGK